MQLLAYESKINTYFFNNEFNKSKVFFLKCLYVGEVRGVNFQLEIGQNAFFNIKIQLCVKYIL